MFCQRLQEGLPFGRVEGVLKIQLQQDMVRGGLLQPHAHLVHQAFGPSEHANTDLLWLKAASCFWLVPGNQQLSGETPKCLAHRNGPDVPPPLAFQAR